MAKPTKDPDIGKNCSTYFRDLEQRSSEPSARCVIIARRLNDDIAYLEMLIAELEKRIEGLDG